MPLSLPSGLLCCCPRCLELTLIPKGPPKPQIWALEGACRQSCGERQRALGLVPCVRFHPHLAAQVKTECAGFCPILLADVGSAPQPPMAVCAVEGKAYGARATPLPLWVPSTSTPGGQPHTPSAPSPQAPIAGMSPC